MQMVKNLKTNASTYSAEAINYNSKIYMDCPWDRWPLTNADIQRYRARERERAKERERVSPTVKVTRLERRKEKNRDNRANVLQVPMDICVNTSSIEGVAEAQAVDLKLREAKAKKLEILKSKIASIVGGTTKRSLIDYMVGKKTFANIKPAWSKALTVEKMYDYIIEWDKANRLDTTTTPTINHCPPSNHFPPIQSLSSPATTIPQQSLPESYPGYYTELLGSPIQFTHHTMETQFDDTQYIEDTPPTHQYHPGLFSQHGNPNIDTLDTPSTHLYNPHHYDYSTATP
jgi:hypothetical protein